MTRDQTDDGGIYAEGNLVMASPKRTGRAITLGGPIAEAQDAETAAEIARRLGAFGDMLAALKMVTAACGPSAYWDGETRAFLEAAEAAIAKAEPDAAPDIAPSTRAALGAALARVPEEPST